MLVWNFINGVQIAAAKRLIKTQTRQIDIDEVRKVAEDEREREEKRCRMNNLQLSFGWSAVRRTIRQCGRQNMNSQWFNLIDMFKTLSCSKSGINYRWYNFYKLGLFSLFKTKSEYKTSSFYCSVNAQQMKYIH